MAVVHDLVVDCLFEDVLEDMIGSLGNGKLLRDPENPDEPYLTKSDGFLQVRLLDVPDPYAYAHALARRVPGLTIVGLYERTK